MVKLTNYELKSYKQRGKNGNLDSNFENVSAHVRSNLRLNFFAEKILFVEKNRLQISGRVLGSHFFSEKQTPAYF